MAFAAECNCRDVPTNCRGVPTMAAKFSWRALIRKCHMDFLRLWLEIKGREFFENTWRVYASSPRPPVLRIHSKGYANSATWWRMRLGIRNYLTSH